MLRTAVAKVPRGRRSAVLPLQRIDTKRKPRPRDDEDSAVTRAIDVLEALERGPADLAGIARATGLTPVASRRLLATLAHGELVVHDPTAKAFMLGPGCFGILDAVARGGGGLGIIARPVLARLNAATQETVALYVRVGPRRICAAQVASPQPVRYTARLGMEKVVHAGSMGKVLLAFSEPAERGDVLEHFEPVDLADGEPADRDALERELQAVRRRGYAVSRHERSTGATSISAPVFDDAGRILAALSVVGPADRLPDAVLARLRPQLVSSAREITARLAVRA